MGKVEDSWGDQESKWVKVGDSEMVFATSSSFRGFIFFVSQEPSHVIIQCVYVNQGSANEMGTGGDSEVVFATPSSSRSFISVDSQEPTHVIIECVNVDQGSGKQMGERWG